MTTTQLIEQLQRYDMADEVALDGSELVIYTGPRPGIIPAERPILRGSLHLRQGIRRDVSAA